jgi:putative heme-binding domain-containing protein
VRKAVANGESQHVAWAYERPESGGRGFGFTGAHNHLSWQNDNFRKVVLNAILWTAQVEVPEDGVPSKTPSDEEMRKNLDDKGNQKKEEKEMPRILELDEVREQQVQKMDTSASLALLVTALANTENPSTRSALLNGILKGLEGQREVNPPAEWEAVSATLSQSNNDEVKSLTEQLSQVFGDEEAAQNALDTLADKDSELDDRRRSLASLLVQQHEELLPILGELLDEKELRIEAIRGYSVFESKAAPDILLERYPEFGPDARRAILETLATRESYATALFDALESKTVSAADLPVYVARSLSHLLGEMFTEKYGMKKLSKDKEAIIAQYRELATSATLADADASKGRLVFQQVCMACHKMYGEGGIIGPDITGSNRADLNYLLLNTIDPSGDIPDAYQMVMITTKSGQLLAGTVTGEDDQKVVLNMIGQQTVVAKSDIQSRETAPVSMMPEGLLQTLEKQQVLNLFKYLQTKEQVDLPK